MPDELFRPDSHKNKPGEDPMRRLVADAKGQPYVAFETLQEAKADPEGVVILQGDDGGQIFVVARADAVACNETMLGQLLRDLDAIEWPGNSPDAATVVYEHRPMGAGVPGGMGGAVVSKGVWVHPRLRDRGLAPDIEEVLAGTRLRIVRPPSDP